MKSDDLKAMEIRVKHDVCTHITIAYEILAFKYSERFSSKFNELGNENLTISKVKPIKKEILLTNMKLREYWKSKI